MKEIKSKLTLGVLFAIIAQVATAQEPLSIKGLDHAETVQFVNGVGTAVAYFDMNLRMEGKQGLFCVPNDDVDPRMVWTLASSSLVGPHDKEMIVIAALDELKKRYPCSSNQ